MRETVWFVEDKHHFAEGAFALLTLLMAFYLFFLFSYSSFGIVAPAWPLMTLLYWRRKWPKFSNLGLFWFVGLLLDLSSQAVLGGYALSLLLVYCFASQMQKSRVISKNMYVESFFVLLMVFIFQSVYLVIQWSVGTLHFSFFYFTQTLLSALLWPWFVVFLQFFHRFFKKVTR